MEFSLNEAQQALQAEARSFLSERFPPNRVAELADSSQGWDPGSWKQLAELGWLGVSAPESAGGGGLTFVEEAVLLEEMGRALYPGPYLATAVVLPALDDERVVEAAGGKQRWSLLLDEGTRFVPELPRVEQVVIKRGDELVAVPAQGEAAESIDATRPVGRLRSTDGEVIREGPEAEQAWRQVQLRLQTGLAAEAVGVASRALEMGVEHAKTREQFGKPIGTYQAVSHRLVDSYMEVELARSLTYWAAWCVAESHPDAKIAAAAAKAAATEAAVAACERSIQVHGGIGFTWESPLHRYYKRALWIERFAGSPAAHRQAIAAELLAPSGAPQPAASADLARTT